MLDPGAALPGDLATETTSLPLRLVLRDKRGLGRRGDPLLALLPDDEIAAPHLTETYLLPSGDLRGVLTEPPSQRDLRSLSNVYRLGVAPQVERVNAKLRWGAVLREWMLRRGLELLDRLLAVSLSHVEAEPVLIAQVAAKVQTTRTGVKSVAAPYPSRE